MTSQSQLDGNNYRWRTMHLAERHLGGIPIGREASLIHSDDIQKTKTGRCQIYSIAAASPQNHCGSLEKHIRRSNMYIRPPR
jgi:hypothetical protein